MVRCTATVTCAAFKPVHKNGCGPLPPQSPPPPRPQKNSDYIHMIFTDTHNLIFSHILRFYNHKQEAAKMFRYDYECTYGHLDCHCSVKDKERLTVLKLNYNNAQSWAFYDLTYTSFFVPRYQHCEMLSNN